MSDLPASHVSGLHAVRLLFLDPFEIGTHTRYSVQQQIYYEDVLKYVCMLYINQKLSHIDT